MGLRWLAGLSLALAVPLACSSAADLGASGAGAGAGATLGTGGTDAEVPRSLDDETGEWAEDEFSEPPDADAGALGRNRFCPGVSAVPRQREFTVGDPDSFASPAIALELLRAGVAPIPQLVRSQDFLNYFPPAPPYSGHPNTTDVSSATLQLRHLEGTSYDLAVSIRASDVAPPASARVVVLIDDTASMGDAAAPGSPLGRAKRIASRIIELAPPGVLLRTVTGVAIASPDDLQNAGLEASINLALASVISAADTAPLDQHDRLFLLTDGKDDPAFLPPELERFPILDASLHVISVAAPLDHPDRYFRAASNLGRGHYVHAGSELEAQVVETQRLPEMLMAALRDVRLQLELPWYFEVEEPPTEALVGDEVGASPKKNLGSGASHTFLFRLTACHESAVDPSALLTATLSFVDPSGLRAQVMISDVAALLLDPKSSDDLLRLRAVYTAAEALKTLDRDALLSAHGAVLAAAKAGTGDPRLVDLHLQLAKHPLLAAP